MQPLDECLLLTRKIAKKREQIEELKAMAISPRNQIISDMPKGGGTINASENYLIKLESLEETYNQLCKERTSKWNEILLVFESYDSKVDETVMLLWLRFYNGYSWNKCIAEMEKRYPNKYWNANKCFRTYRRFLHKMDEANL